MCTGSLTELRPGSHSLSHSLTHTHTQWHSHKLTNKREPHVYHVADRVAPRLSFSLSLSHTHTQHTPHSQRVTLPQTHQPSLWPLSTPPSLPSVCIWYCRYCWSVRRGTHTMGMGWVGVGDLRWGCLQMRGLCTVMTYTHVSGSSTRTM